MHAPEARPAIKSFAFSTAEAISQRGLRQLLDSNALQAWFQQIIDLRDGSTVGYEGLIRGPGDSPYHAPVKLFSEAERLGLSGETETAARLAVIRGFAALELPGQLFLNVSPGSLAHPDLRNGLTTRMLQDAGLSPQRVVIELTENKPFFDVDGITAALRHFRDSGFGVAIDDLGAGFSSLRLWSELLPDIVKLDMHFVQGVHRDSIKYNFLRAIQDIAARCGTFIVAEGVETEDDLLAVRKLGIRYGQGYLIARPSARPALGVPTRVRALLSAARMQLLPEDSPLSRRQGTVEKLLIPAVAFDATATNEAIFQHFEKNLGQIAIPITSADRPVGLINRHSFIDRFARQYDREIFGRKSCLLFADRCPLIVDKDMTIHNLSRTLIDAESRHLSEGFIITESGHYLGYGTGQDLVREITQMQIEAARYANPLTLLPGNVPIDEHMQRLLHAGMPFVVCHCDLDSFKPLNDRYGYQRGDDMLLLTARVLAGACDDATDFIGHVGGDDFILLMQSADWEGRIQRALMEFDQAALGLFDIGDREANGFQGVDRQGNPVAFPLTTLSVGAVIIDPGTHHQHKEVAMRAAEAKKQAKRMRGSVCFVERRALPAAHP